MQALERLWDRPAVRWPLALAAVLVLFAGIRTVYEQNHHTAHVTIVPGGGEGGRCDVRPPDQAAAEGRRRRPHVHPHRGAPQEPRRGVADRDREGPRRPVARAVDDRDDPGVRRFPRHAYGETRYKVEWSRSKNVMLLALITPDKPGVKSGEFFIQMVPHGKTWLVDYFGPRGTNPPFPPRRCTSSWPRLTIRASSPAEQRSPPRRAGMSRAAPSRPVATGRTPSGGCAEIASPF